MPRRCSSSTRARRACRFLAQYEQAGLKGKVPLYQVYTIDSLSLPQQKEQALGVLGTQQWVNDLPNDANKRFVADFLKKHNAYPSFYGAQAYDTIMLIASAAEAVKGDVSKKDDFRAALRKANFKSVRGDFKFGNNHFPIQNFYLQESGKDRSGPADAQDGRDRLQGSPGRLRQPVQDEVVKRRE